jgi:uncharacterized iron-regulated membrane protein
VPLRRVLFWVHLAAGVTCGLVIVVMSFTGALLALQPQILLWAERDLRTVQPPSPDAPWLGPDALIAGARERHPDMTVTGLTREHDRTLAASVTLTKSAPAASGGPPAPQTTVWLNPYTGAEIAQQDPTTAWRRFFRTATDWHRWLGVSGDGRTAARWITGVSNAAFLVLAVTGIYLWIPRLWSHAAIRAVAWFRPGLAGKARDFNWHNVIGVWSAAVLVVLTFTGMCISFPKTYDVIYAVTGIERPPAPAAPTAGPQRSARDTGEHAASPALVDTGFDRLWAVAESQMPRWRSIAMRLPQRAGQLVTFTMNDRERVNAMARSTLTVNPTDGQVIRWEPYEQLATGQRLRTWMRFGHTGELWGLAGQIVAGAASAGGCVLVWTGIALAWRRVTAWLARRRRDDRVPIGRAA